MDEQPKGIVVIIEDAGARKIEAIREIRRLTGLGLKAAKTATDRAPSCIKVVATSHEADQAVDQLRNAGAKATAVDPGSPLAQSATPLSVFQNLSKPATAPAGGWFYRIGFWVLLAIVLYFWLQSG